MTAVAFSAGFAFGFALGQLVVLLVLAFFCGCRTAPEVAE